MWKVSIFPEIFFITVNIVRKSLRQKMPGMFTFQDTTSLVKIFLGDIAESDRSVLNTYVVKDNSEGKMFFKCTLCGKCNTAKQTTINHVENKFLCSLCEFSSTNRVHVLNHVESVHFPGSFKYHCDNCPKVFNSKNAKNVHISKFHKS